MGVFGEPVFEEDKELIEKQIGAREADPYLITKRCPFGAPYLITQKLHHYGELDLGRLSNPIWLTCPYMNEKIHSLEDKGYIVRITDFVQSDRVMMTNMHDAHAHFYFFRKHLYMKQFSAPYPEELLAHFNKGIGGILNIKFIKCLHLHFGHYILCKKNIVGQITKLLADNKIYCKDGRCTCLKE